MLPKLRKSLQKNEKRISPPVLSQKTPYAIEAPKAVIRALYDYTQGSTQELSFSKGDFFHVVGNDRDMNWYDACNPATGAKGLVPVQYFQVLGKNQKESAEPLNSAPKIQAMPISTTNNQTTIQRAPSGAKAAPLYGVVQYDFQAERPDELDAKAGEAIIIIAQSNHEWFVAKPIGRLGGPGLIPVSFIQIRDMATGKPIGNLEEIAAKAAVPKVEEWKKAAAQYKNSSIPLGRFDFDKDVTETTATPPFVDGSTAIDHSDHAPSTNPYLSDDLFVAKASVDQFLLDGTKYWFLVRVEMNDGRHRNLCRYYEDFYDFQIALLEEFPAEAGRTGESRILPFMPGPLAYVDDTITAQRRADLNIYVEELCQLPAHVVRSKLVQTLFAAREGDVESSHPTSMMPQPTYRQTNSIRSSTSRRVSHQSGMQTNRSSEQQQQHQQQQPQKDWSQNRYSNQKSNMVSPVSSIPQAQTQHSSGAKETVGSSFIKLKVFYDDDLIAIRVASDINYEQLCEKLRDRLSAKWSIISVKDEARNVYRQISDDEDFQDLLHRTDKIVLYVQ